MVIYYHTPYVGLAIYHACLFLSILGWSKRQFEASKLSTFSVTNIILSFKRNWVGVDGHWTQFGHTSDRIIQYASRFVQTNLSCVIKCARIVINALKYIFVHTYERSIQSHMQILIQITYINGF